MLKIAGTTLLVTMTAFSAASADVRLSLRNGRVSLTAKDATPRQILAEWARLGKAKVVNLDGVSGAPTTLELDDVSEQQALDIVLRGVSGYVLAPRTAPEADLSRFDRIIVMPASAAPRPSGSPAAGAVYAQPAAPPAPVNDDDDQPEQTVPTPAPARGPLFNAFPQPRAGDPTPQNAPGSPQRQGPFRFPGTGGPVAPAAPSAVPTSPAGTARPGEIVRPATQPGGAQPGVATPNPESN